MNIGPLRVLGVQHVDVTPTLQHVEIYTMSGLLTLLWHGSRRADRVALMGGGAMGGLLGPAGGFYHWLGDRLAERGMGAIRVSYRQPNQLGACVGDMVAAGMLAEREGAEAFVTLGHSFGGAVAVGAAIEPSPLADAIKGVCTFATQSAGCEEAGLLRGRPLVLFHGDRDEILPVWASMAVNELAGGHGELVVLPGAGHLLGENGADAVLRDRVPAWIESAFGR